MKLTPEAREAVDEAIASAHRDGRPTREIAAEVVSALHGFEPSGEMWPTSLIDDLAVVGAMKMCSDWRRSHQVQTPTKRGLVDLPAFVGQTNDDGEAVQLALVGLDLDGVIAHRDRLVRQRDTLSVEVTALDALIKVMQADETLTTAGAAIAALGKAA